jgi:LacI family transcriptional regulator
MSRRIDGLALVSAGADQDLRALLRSIRVPVVIVDREIKGVTADLVEVDHEQGGYLAARHLIELGHRRIAMIAGPRGLPVSVQRLAGFRRGLAEAGLSLRGAYLMHRDFTLADGFDAARQLLALEQRPTALFAGNDLLALGAIHAAHDARLVPGKDVSVVGFDDVALTSFIRPRLTTIRQPKHRIGEEAAKLLIERMNGTRRHACHKIFAPDLLRGDTTKTLTALTGNVDAPRQRRSRAAPGRS